jgi:hypothetical protein
MLIAAGFGIFVISTFPMLKAFGLTCVWVIVVALFCDIVVTMSFVALFGARILKKDKAAAQAAARPAPEQSR